MPKVGGESYLLLAHSREKKLKACPEILSTKSKSYIIFYLQLMRLIKRFQEFFY